MNLPDELRKLHELRESGGLNDDEFMLAKAKLLKEQGNAESDEPTFTLDSRPSLEAETRQWAMFLHLSMLATFVIPLGGLIVPILIWQIKKKELPGIDVHGKNAVNWIISSILYGIFSLILVFVLIGIPILIALGVVSIVFPILAGVKANNGEVWKYPMSITFLN